MERGVARATVGEPRLAVLQPNAVLDARWRMGENSWFNAVGGQTTRVCHTRTEIGRVNLLVTACTHGIGIANRTNRSRRLANTRTAAERQEEPSEYDGPQAARPHNRSLLGRYSKRELRDFHRRGRLRS